MDDDHPFAEALAQPGCCSKIKGVPALHLPASGWAIWTEVAAIQSWLSKSNR
jgi:hypothetical protein